MQSNTRTSEPLWPFLLLAAVVAAATVVYAATLIARLPEAQDRGLFGDMFGALNAAFSGLAFAALAYTLNLQRKELAETRAVLQQQATAQAEQADTALRAAEISALGSLYQAYSQLIAAGHPVLIARGDWRIEVERVRDRLNKLLKEAPKGNTSAAHERPGG